MTTSILFHPFERVRTLDIAFGDGLLVRKGKDSRVWQINRSPGALINLYFWVAGSNQVCFRMELGLLLNTV